MSKIKTVLLRDTPKPVSPWRTDIENAPRDGTYIYAIIECENEIIFYLCGIWYRKFYYHLAENKFENSDITYWMPIPEIPTI